MKEVFIMQDFLVFSIQGNPGRSKEQKIIQPSQRDRYKLQVVERGGGMGRLCAPRGGRDCGPRVDDKHER